MAARMTGWAMLCSSSVQEAHDLALIAQRHARVAHSVRALLRWLPHVARGQQDQVLSDDDVRAMIDDELVFAHRARALDPDRPVVRASRRIRTSTSRVARPQPFYAAVPSIVQAAMDRFATLTGRQYRLFEYSAPPTPST